MVTARARWRGILGILLPVWVAACPARTARPNVLLITLDTTRADHLGCYGYGAHTSPNLDALAACGALFTRAVSQAAVTPVSHASILTGLNPYHHGLRVMHGKRANRLPSSLPTLATVLRRAGYATAAFVSAFPVTGYFGFDRGFERFDAAFLQRRPGAVDAQSGIVNTGDSQQNAAVTTERALAWMASGRRPFFLWVHYFDPHDALVLPPRSWIDPNTLTGSPAERLRELYDAEISYMDDNIGRLLGWLEDSAEKRRTIVVVTADHGEGLGDHNWWTHGILYQEQIHIPLIMRAPGLPAPRRIDALVRSIDVMPTVLDLAGVDRSVWPDMDGRSLVPLWRGNTVAGSSFAYADSVNTLTYRVPALGGNGFFTDAKRDRLFALTDGKWKYVHHLEHEEESELYDLDGDPEELKNQMAAHPKEVRRLRAELFRRNFMLPPATRTSSTEVPLSPPAAERLRALGYLD